MSDANASNAEHRRVSELLSVISHDIRAPLGVILGAVAELNDPRLGPLTDAQRSLLLLVRRGSERLSRLAANVLFVRRRLEGFTPAREHLDLRELARRAVGLFERSGELKKITVSVQVPEARVDVEGEAELLVQLIVNLVANALRSSRREVVVTVSGGEAGALVTVDDDGPGFPPELLPLLFGDAGPAAPDAAEKTPRGLGLEVARGVAEAHGAVLSGENRADATGRTVGARAALRFAV